MAQTTQDLLASRYGKKSTPNKKRNSVLASLGVAVLSIGAAYFGFANYSPVSFKDVGFRVISNIETEIDFEITKPTDATATCELEALNNAFGVIGYKKVFIETSTTQTTRHTATVITTEKAVTGLVANCTLN
ncbi:MAG: DUF4307 domain-containing protein [Aquiluna sp.]|nr:DUF4307 domain-containing protein [Aquiluna sp.]MCF8545371.1 DUF4307 domain-containing protein [Aquiluna sp.]